MLNKSTIAKLESSKNLLAFSAGGDSTALLFLLLQHEIKFDIAIVDYEVREQSKLELCYAHELAKKHDFECFSLTSPMIESNFEANARQIRYDFFDELIAQRGYDNLLTAHHLGDRFEWMLMQFCKGAGCPELTGMKELESRKNYALVRPLLHLDKSELLLYLQENKIRYFEDESNLHEKYKRNYFRKNHAKPLLEKHLSGIKKSFEYMDEDVRDLVEEMRMDTLHEFAYAKSSHGKRSDLLSIDKYFKSIGFLISSNEKNLLKKNDTVVISRKFVVNQEHGFVFITPYMEAKEMTKEFKEKMRHLKIEPKLRAYVYSNKEVEALITSLLS